MGSPRSRKAKGTETIAGQPGGKQLQGKWPLLTNSKVWSRYNTPSTVGKSLWEAAQMRKPRPVTMMMTTRTSRVPCSFS